MGGAALWVGEVSMMEEAIDLGLYVQTVDGRVELYALDHSLSSEEFEKIEARLLKGVRDSLVARWEWVRDSRRMAQCRLEVMLQSWVPVDQRWWRHVPPDAVVYPN